MISVINVVKATRKIIWKFKKPDFFDWSWPKEDEREKTNELIRNLLQSENPCFIGRIGTGERNIVNSFKVNKDQKSIINKISDHIKFGNSLPWREGLQRKLLCNNAGFFPCEDKLIDRFCELYLHDIPSMDVVGRMSYQEDFLPIKNAIHVQLETLYPFFVENPWTESLKEKKVLVIHPFSETILQQFKKRELLFNNSKLLPLFKLEIIKAVQSIAGNKVPFDTWFDALESMKQQMDKIDYEVALIGCGAYGLPIAAHAKRMGKKSVLLSGGLQLLFGIKGKRWEKDYTNSCYRDMFNKNWVYPSDNEKPSGAEKIEGGCYW